MEQALRHRATAQAAGRRPSPPTRFTPLELAAAEQLIHLSVSSCSSGAAFTPRGSGSAASACYSSSSPRSVNAPPACDDRPVDAGEKDNDDEQEVGWRPRKNRRYRLISEIYKATEELRGARRRKIKGAAGSTMEQRRK